MTTNHSENPSKSQKEQFTDKLIREPECKELTCLTRQYRLVLERQGKFPKRIKLGERAHAWRLSEVLNWIEQVSQQRSI